MEVLSKRRHTIRRQIRSRSKQSLIIMVARLSTEGSFRQPAQLEPTCQIPSHVTAPKYGKTRKAGDTSTDTPIDVQSLTSRSWSCRLLSSPCACADYGSRWPPLTELIVTKFDWTVRPDRLLTTAVPIPSPRAHLVGRAPCATPNVPSPFVDTLRRRGAGATGGKPDDIVAPRRRI